MTKEGLVSYWRESSEQDSKAMMHLFKKRDYQWSLFVGHLVLEKLFKANYVQRSSENPPFIHDLLRLAERGVMVVGEDKKKTCLIPYQDSISVHDTTITNKAFGKNVPGSSLEPGSQTSRN